MHHHHNHNHNHLITSNMNWCEEDWVVSPYVAEWFNTLSSIPVAMFGLHGLIHVLRHGLGSLNASLHFLCLVIGIGSVWFHSQLSSTGQAADELPMLWCSSLCLFAIIRTTVRNRCSDDKSPTGKIDEEKYTFLAGLIIFAVDVIVTYAYFRQGFLLFFIVYSLTVATMIIVSFVYVSRRENFVSEKQKTQHTILLFAGSTIYVFGFLLLWVPEMIFCGNRLESQHETIVAAFKLHALFHLTSAVGSYCWCVFACFSDRQLEIEKRNPSRGEKVRLEHASAWTSMFVTLPQVVVLKKKK
jgi:dihydroceramidase